MKFSLVLVSMVLCTCSFAQKNQSKLSLLTSYDFPGKYNKPFALQGAYEVNPLSVENFNLQFSIGYAQNTYAHLYEGYPGYAACYYTQQSGSVTTSNFCWGETIYSKRKILQFTAGINFIYPVGKKWELKISSCIMAIYRMYSRYTAVFFHLSNSPVEYTSTYKYDNKGRPSEWGIQPELWLGYKLSAKLKLVLRMMYYREFENFFEFEPYCNLGAGFTYTFNTL